MSLFLKMDECQPCHGVCVCVCVCCARVRALVLASERTVMEYQRMSGNFGLTVSILKTKHFIAGTETKDEDKTPITVEGGGH